MAVLVPILSFMRERARPWSVRALPAELLLAWAELEAQEEKPFISLLLTCLSP